MFSGGQLDCPEEVCLKAMLHYSLSPGVNFKEVNKENKETIFGDIHTSIDSLAFTFGNV